LIQIKELAERVKDCFGVSLGTTTLKQYLKKWGFRWKRMRKSAKSRRNEADFEFFKEELRILESMEDSQEIDLYYFDEMVGPPMRSKSQSSSTLCLAAYRKNN
jgi:Winged helix-turn helix